MRKSAQSAGSSEGFTLLEVMVAAAILAGAVATLVAIYVNATERASDTRDVTVSAALARNAVAEGFAAAIEPAVELTIPERPALRLEYSEWPSSEEELPVSDSLTVDVTRDGARVMTFASRRALYITELSEESAEEEEEAGEDEGDE